MNIHEYIKDEELKKGFRMKRRKRKETKKNKLEKET